QTGARESATAARARAGCRASDRVAISGLRSAPRCPAHRKARPLPDGPHGSKSLGAGLLGRPGSLLEPADPPHPTVPTPKGSNRSDAATPSTIARIHKHAINQLTSKISPL